LLAGLAETHRAAAALVGLSRSQATNIINYQFNPSPAVAQRVLELADESAESGRPAFGRSPRPFVLGRGGVFTLVSNPLSLIRQQVAMMFKAGV
jgi:hypothetical protein